MLVAIAKTSRSRYYGDESLHPNVRENDPLNLVDGSRAKGELVVKEAFEGLAQLQ